MPMMISFRPTRRAVLFQAALVLVALAPSVVDPRLWTLWVGALAVLAFTIGLDAVLTPSARRTVATVTCPDPLFIGETAAARLVLEVAPTRHRLRAVVLVDVNELLEPTPAVDSVIAPHEGAAEIEIPLVPRRRGTAVIEAVWIRLLGPLGLVQSVRRIGIDRSIRVLPNINAVRAAALGMVRSEQRVTGLRVKPFVGEGSEFESLKEFARGHDHRAISWKASARHRKLLAQEFRAERDHQVILAIDTGHLMSEPIDGVPKLDHAINAALLLAYCGLRAGDRVGLYGFDTNPGAFTAPIAGVRSFHTLRTRTAELAYTSNETNFTLGLSELSSRLRRRSLIVLLTDVVDDVSARLMVENLGRLIARHLVLFAGLRDPTLDRITAARPRRIADVHRAVVANDFLLERERVLARLHRLGIHCIDAAPEELTPHLVSRYLYIKRRELV